MYVPCILAGGVILTWFKSMRTLFGRLKKKKSGQAVKPTTACQGWTLKCFKFLEAHLTILTDTHQVGKVVVPVEVEEEEEEVGDDDNTASLASARISSQVHIGTQPSTSQAGPSQACDRKPKAATNTSTGKRVYDAILKLAAWLTINTGVQDHPASAVEDRNNPHLTFLPVDGPEGVQAFRGAVDRVHAGVLPDDSALQAAQAQQLVPPPPPHLHSILQCSYTSSQLSCTPQVHFYR